MATWRALCPPLPPEVPNATRGELVALRELAASNYHAALARQQREIPAATAV